MLPRLSDTTAVYGTPKICGNSFLSSAQTFERERTLPRWMSAVVYERCNAEHLPVFYLRSLPWKGKSTATIYYFLVWSWRCVSECGWHGRKRCCICSAWLDLGTWQYCFGGVLTPVLLLVALLCRLVQYDQCDDRCCCCCCCCAGH